MPSFIVQCFNMLLLIMLSAIWHIGIILSFFMLSDIMLSALIPSDSMLCGIERSVIVGIPVMCGIVQSVIIGVPVMCGIVLSVIISVPVMWALCRVSLLVSM